MKDIERIVCWFSCGVASAVATKLTLEKYSDSGIPIVIAYCHNDSESDDNLRFISECEQVFKHPITALRSETYTDTFDVYNKTKYMSGIYGARCSLELKKRVRQKFENLETDLQIFGFTLDEEYRAKRFVENNPEVRTSFPLILGKLSKSDCFRFFDGWGIKIPAPYRMGYKNNNCHKTGCVKAGAGYWNKFRKDYPDSFERMAKLSRELGVRLIMYKKQHIFLDELPLGVGRYKLEQPIECGLFCGTNGEKE